MNAASIRVTRWGTRGPKIVMVHGGVQGSMAGGDQQFGAQKSLAEEDWQLILPDRPGHGGSADPGRGDDSAADGILIAGLLEDGVHLMGHSFGGCVALSAAAQQPSAVRSLTLVEPGMFNLANRESAVRKFGLQMLFVMLTSLTHAQRARRAIKLLGIPAEVTNRFSADEYRRMGSSFLKARFPSGPTLQRELGVVKSARIPLMVVTGGWSAAFERTADHVAAAGDGQRRTVASGHHFPHLLGGEFNSLLKTFMTESDARRQR